MKPLVRLTIKIREAHDHASLHTIGVLDVNTAGDSVLILDRDQMGVPFIESSETKGDVEWKDLIDELRAAVYKLQHSALASEIAGRTVHSSLFALRRILEESSNEGYPEGDMCAAGTVADKP